jgi:hypothetical protein
LQQQHLKRIPLRLTETQHSNLFRDVQSGGHPSAQAYLIHLIETAPGQIARLKKRVRELEALHAPYGPSLNKPKL